jgi:hypothetical protein
MIKFIQIIFLCVISMHALADDRPSNDCIASAHANYSKAFNVYWNLINSSFGV